MKKIEGEMVDAIAAKRNWHKENTEVQIVQRDSSVLVLLFGNAIAQLNADGSIAVNHCGWQTITTKSRLNAVLAVFGKQHWAVSQKDFKWALRDDGGVQDFDSSGWHQVHKI